MPRSFNTTTPLGRLMAEQGWKRQELAGVVGIAERTLSEYLSGRRPIPTRTAWALAEALRCDVRVLVTGDRRRQIDAWRRSNSSAA